MRFRHPSRDRLTQWLVGAGGDDRDVEAHIDTCDRCASVVEALGEGAGEAPLALALSQILAPPKDLPVRLEQRVSARLSSRELMGLMAEMFGAGVETSRLLIVEPSPPRD